MGAMADTIVYRVPGMHCAHCKTAIESEVGAVPGVEAVNADLDTKLVIVSGDGLNDTSLRAAIDEAGYDAE
jgi:copper chaperone CopZ